MASTSSSIAAILSRRLLLSRTLFSTPKPSHLFSTSFSTGLSSAEDSDSPNPFRALDLDSGSVPDSPSPPPPSSSSSSDSSYQQRMVFDRPLENGLDIGIYKAILVGQVGQSPLQKRLRSGKNVVLFSLGTGGIRNNRRPLDNEEPRDYANRCAVQWHRVSIYPDRLGDIAMKHVIPGAILYLEGNLETKIFTDPVSGLVRRIREIAIRGNDGLDCRIYEHKKCEAVSCMDAIMQDQLVMVARSEKNTSFLDYEESNRGLILKVFCGGFWSHCISGKRW